jgi:hypothetical protein
MKESKSALVYPTLARARAFRNKFRAGHLIARVGKSYVILSEEQADKIRKAGKLNIVDEQPKMRHFKSLKMWQMAAGKAGCKVTVAPNKTYFTATRDGETIGAFVGAGVSSGHLYA